MTQQTINGTVYRVGQKINARWLLRLPEGAEVKRLVNPVECLSKEHELDLLCFEITALPNPDPVIEKPTPLTREELLTDERVWFKDVDGIFRSTISSSCKGGLHYLGVELFRTEAECRLYHELEANND